MQVTRQRIPRTSTHEAASHARRFVDTQLRWWDRGHLADDGQLVASELVTNALLHAHSDVELRLAVTADGVRIEVLDANPQLPVPPPGDGRPLESMTGRGLQLVQALATRWGAERTDGGKVVWAELTEGQATPEPPADEAALLAMWDDTAARDWSPGPADANGQSPQRVVLDAVPVGLVLACRAHTDNLVREFALAAAGAEAGMTTAVPPQLATTLGTVTTAFADARHAMERQALAARRRGEDVVTVELELAQPTAQAALAYIEALEAADAHCNAERLLTLETPPRVRAFRRWYVDQIVRQLADR